MPSFTFFILSLVASTALAQDVYATFEASGQAIQPSFDVGNNGCFAVQNADTVSFSQSGDGKSANGPYCLQAWTSGACPGVPGAQQQFETVNFGVNYILNSGISSQGSYKWETQDCVNS